VPRSRRTRKPPRRRSPAAAALPKFKPKRIPDRRRKAEERRARREARHGEHDDI
jgi:hypothetical protein